MKVRVNLPVCRRCARRKLNFYLATFAALGVSIAGFQLAASGHAIGRYLSIFFLVALALYVVAIRSTPIKILDYRPETDLVSLGCHHDRFAAEMAAVSGGVDAPYVRVRREFWVLILLVLVVVVAAIALGY